MNTNDRVTTTLFLADGEKHVRRALRLNLELAGEIHIAGEAGSAESALAQVCQQPPDAILLDWNLPGLHPQRMLRALRRCCPTTLVLAASVRPEQEFAARQLGVDGFLSKQLPPDEFINQLAAAFSQHQ
jgi:DNA-binding NarL/FixJ family response regulator